MELTTDQKGTAAETAIIHAAARIGVVVFEPISDGVRYDLIFDVHGALLRVQVKWARLHGGVVIIGCYSARRAREGLRSRNHTAAEVDALAAWCPDLDRSFLLLPEHFAGRPCSNSEFRRRTTTSVSESIGRTSSTSRLDCGD